MTQIGKIGLDTSVLMGLLDPKDVWHKPATELHDNLKRQMIDIVVFDCVLAETISVLSRRLHEKRRSGDINKLITVLLAEYPPVNITWILPEVPRLYSEVIELIRLTSGEMNFNDALIALVCRDNNIPMLASFDRDFDSVNWLRRIAHPSDLVADNE